MENLDKLWHFTLFTVSGGAISVGQVIMTTLFTLIALLLGRYLMRLLALFMTRRMVDPNVVQIVSMIFFWGLLVLIVMTALAMLKIPITHLAFITGAIAVGVGFGSQNIINNLISGWILMSEKPVRIDDIVELDQHLGRVERIGNRSTRIRRIDGVHILVPNSQLLERIVVNWTLLDRRFRTIVRVGVEYGSPVRQVEALMLEAARAHKHTLADPPPVVVFEDFGDNALMFELFFWCEISTGAELRLIRSDIRFRIDELFRENGIVIAFPQRDVHLDLTGPLEVRLNEAKSTDG
jgi:small-conductance mechanosensitive channel